MRLRRQIYRPSVHTTDEIRRPITLRVAGLEFDLTPRDARQLADALTSAITKTEGRQQLP
jgi:hypothetical protein